MQGFADRTPDGMVPFITTVRTLTDLHPLDIVLGFRPDNGLRGIRRVPFGVIVGRYIPAVEERAS